MAAACDLGRSHGREEIDFREEWLRGSKGTGARFLGRPALEAPRLLALSRLTFSERPDQDGLQCARREPSRMGA
jgi:hypothetical protein